VTAALAHGPRAMLDARRTSKKLVLSFFSRINSVDKATGIKIPAIEPSNHTILTVSLKEITSNLEFWALVDAFAPNLES